MNFLTVGFGNMGCRHTQSLLNSFASSNFWVLEPSEDTFLINCEKIGALPERFKRINVLDELNENIDFAIVATSAFPRFEIVKSLLNNGVKKILVEKVVFQSGLQFKEIAILSKLNGAEVYCNFVNRYFPNYQLIKAKHNSGKIIMNVLGGDFGLGCNALHYIDLFEFLTGNSAYLVGSLMEPNDNGNRRGNIYKELLGQLMWETGNGDRLIILADKNRKGGNEIIINQEGTVNVLNEETMKHFIYSSGKISSTDFKILRTSELTATILNDINEKKCILPTIQESENIHVQFFQEVNKVFNLAINDLCPIT